MKKQLKSEGKIELKRERFLENFSKEVEAGNAAVFAGAGFSCAAGFVNWSDLLSDIANDLDLDSKKEADLVAVAQYHVNRHGNNRGHLTRAVLEEFPSERLPTGNHRLLMRLPISTWWTTNYDKLIERAGELEGKIVDIKYEVSQMAHTKPRRDLTVFKMHGDIDHPGKAVLTRDDYEEYPRERDTFLNALSGDLISKTFLFIGFSFTDPNLERVLSHVRIRLRENQRPHYAIFKTVDKADYDSADEYQYARVKQELVLEDLRRFNINPVMIDEYSEIDKIIRSLYGRHVAKNVFVSTSAASFEPWGEAAVTEFMGHLGTLLAQRGFRIVTGLGVGTGSALVSGAIVEISRDPKKKLDDDIIIRPFPQLFQDGLEREQMWRDYRNDMIQRAGIALFLFGNKNVDGEIRNATGMIEEFKIARENGLMALPIGATGWIASELAEQVINELDQELANPIIDKLRRIAEPTEDLMTLIGAIIDLLEELSNFAGDEPRHISL